MFPSKNLNWRVTGQTDLFRRIGLAYQDFSFKPLFGIGYPYRFKHFFISPISLLQGDPKHGEGHNPGKRGHLGLHFLTP